jgi:dTMP kinase
MGEHVRELVLDPAVSLDPWAEALLMAAARAQHVAEVIRPALDGGQCVVTDRYAHSSIAYQGYGRGLPLDEVRRLSELATGGLWPEVVVLLDVPDDVARARLVAHDRFEAESWDFRAAVAAGYRAMAADEGWTVVDGVGTPDEVEARVWAAVSPRLAL